MKETFEYILKRNMKDITMIYSIILLVFVVLVMVLRSMGDKVNAQINGMDAMCIIYVLISGIYCYNSHLKLMNQNGISRKTFFWGSFASIAVVSVIISATNLILGIITKVSGLDRGAEGPSMMRINSNFEETFSMGENENPVIYYIKELVIFAFAIILAYQIGRFIAASFVRMGKSGRIGVGAGVPLLLFVILPAFDYKIDSYNILKGINEFFGQIYGTSSGNVYLNGISLIITVFVVSVLTWIIMRKTDIRSYNI